jgi:hypothetical protein
MLSLIKRAILAVQAWAHRNPAIAGWLLSVAAAILAHYRLHVNATTLAEVLAAVNAVIFGWVHSKVTPVAKLGGK